MLASIALRQRFKMGTADSRSPFREPGAGGCARDSRTKVFCVVSSGKKFFFSDQARS
jgi:hypothetical protein